MSNIRPYKVAVPDSQIKRLKAKLQLVDFPAEIEDEELWVRGVPLSEMKRVVNYWINSYDWRKTEEKLNTTMSQFTTDVTVPDFGTMNVHFVHQRSSCRNAIPLLFMHGWPGNFTEVEKILPLLVENAGTDSPAFHVVAPSLIDYGFSSRSAKKGFTTTQHGHAYHDLMRQLGYDKYVIQGGDLGAFIARRMVHFYQSSIGGHLINLAMPREPTKERDPELFERIQNTPLTDEEKVGMQRTPWFRNVGIGYNKLQSTKPQTIGYSMADSPVGLLAWIYEKLHDWSDEYPWTEDEILQWVCIYAFSRGGPNATQHIYYEDNFRPSEPRPYNYSTVPLGISRFPKELVLQPKLWHETMGPLVFWSEHNSGGHFAAWEKPNELVDDMRRMFGRQGPCYGCCGKGKNGYEDDSDVNVDIDGEKSKL